MRFWTTLFLVIATAGGAVLWRYWSSVAPAVGLAEPKIEESKTSIELKRITPESLIRIELDDVRLDRQGGVWNLPGEWPTRTSEVDALVNELAHLQSRFVPEVFNHPQKYGMAADQKPVTIRATVKSDDQGQKTYTLVFGEPISDTGNPFVRSTYLHMDDQPEVLRLAPGLIDRLRKGRDDFLRRQLFPNVVRAKVSDTNRPAIGGENDLPPPAVALLNAKELAVTGPDGSWSLRHTTNNEKRPTATGPVTIAPEKLAGSWEMVAPVVDHVDPDKLKGVLAAVPDLWAEAFVGESDLAKTGLDQPERTISVKNSDGDLKVLIGKVSRVNEIKPPAPPPSPNPLAPPPPPPPPIREEYRYAKLPNHPQVFELRTDKFPDLFVKPADLRDPRIARYRSTDVTKLEIAGRDRRLVFAKEKDASTHDERWHMLEPVKAAAEGPKVIELVEKLSDLQARGDAIIDSTELKNYGLAESDPVTTVNVTVREEQSSEGTEGTKNATNRVVTYRLGKAELAKAKVYLQVNGVARIDAVPDDLLKLVDRPILAYRSRRVLELAANKLSKISVDRSNDPYSLIQLDGKWSLATPVVALADSAKTNSLAADLAHLEAADFVNFTPSPDDLKNYALDVPSLIVNITPIDGAMRSLHIGKARDGKPEIYAKLADAPEVFALRQAVRDAIDLPSLAFRPLQLWQVAGINVQAIKIGRSTDPFILNRDGALWRISAPFEAGAFLPAVQPLLDAAMAPRAEKFEAHNNDELAKFGLDQPAITMVITVQGERPGDPNVTKELLLGKPVTEGQPARFAKLPDQPGVFVVGPTIADAVNKSALDMLDRRLLTVDTRLINKITGSGVNGVWSAKKDGDKWVIDSLSPPAVGDRSVVDFFVNSFADIRASRFAAYNSTDLAQFGLDQTSAAVTVSLATGDQPITHTIVLGKSTPDDPNARFARVDNGPAIAVLPIGLSKALAKSALDFVDRSMFSFAAKDLVAIRRQMGEQELLLEFKDGAWKMTKPQELLADDPTIFEIVERLANLRAVKVAALGVKDLKPFGLDAPHATFTLTVKQAEGSPREFTMKLGTAGPDGRFAQVGNETVYVLSDSKNDPLATRLLSDSIKFRDRTLVKFNDADRVVVSRGSRPATFAKVDGQWKMTAPIMADAEGFDLDDLVLAASRLRADELVADQPNDLKSLGLDPPEGEIRFFQGDQDVARLLVSNKGPDGRATVKSAGGSLVGKLEPGLSTRFLNEFRKRSLWNNLDAVQTDTVVINSGAGGTPLTLLKIDTGWQVATGSGQVKPEAVSELVAAMASLKAERFVVDEKADLKLFGLDPPVRVIVVKTRNGQTTTLNLGRFEGDSKRVYANVPGASWVVVLNEADSGKLMKDVAEMVAK